jgi:hypothetical protein
VRRQLCHRLSCKAKEVTELGTNDLEKRAIYLDSQATAEIDQIASSLEFVRDMNTFLRFIRENRIIGTQSTGNMPVKMVAELAKLLVHPPAMEEKVGDRIYKIRSELDVWPIYFPHILAEVGKLVKTPPGKQWRLTSAGETFQAQSALHQIFSILIIWWHSTNWLVAFPIAGMGESLPPHFESVTLGHLADATEKEIIGFEEFADAIIAGSGLTWTSENKTNHQMYLHKAVERIVVDVHTTFGILEPYYKDNTVGAYTSKSLESFKVSRLGKLLIQSLCI